MTEILVTGETLIDFLPDGNADLVDTETFHRRAGGAPANVAVGLARLGEPPLFWTRLAEDPLGDHLAATLTENDVRPDLIERDPEADTTLAFVSLDPDADRAFSFHRHGTADTRLRPGTVDDDTLAGVEWVHAGGVALADEPSRSATIDLLERASGTDTVVSFDPNTRPELFEGDDLVTTCRRAFTLVDVVKASSEDLLPGLLDGVDADPARADPTVLARGICDQGPHTALVTRGPDGPVAHATPAAPWNPRDETLVVDHPGYDADTVDTTGAGDAFTAGAIRSLADEESLETALGFANAVAAQSTTAKGAMAALPARETVDRFRERRGD